MYTYVFTYDKYSIPSHCRAKQTLCMIEDSRSNSSELIPPIAKISPSSYRSSIKQQSSCLNTLPRRFVLLIHVRKCGVRHPCLFASSFGIKSFEKQNLIRFLLVLVIPLVVRTVPHTKFDTLFLGSGVRHVNEVAFRDSRGDTEWIFEDGFDWAPDLTWLDG